jgi:hypothetical protein
LADVIESKMSDMALINSNIVEEGLKILVEKMGLQKATQFIVSLERGKGDSVQEINEYWGDASVEEIHNQIMAWKSEQK